MSDRNSPCVVARDPRCGHIRMAYVDDGTPDAEVRKRHGQWVASAIRVGQQIERVTSDVVRAEMGACETCEPGVTAKRARYAAALAAAQGGLGL